MKYPLTKSAKDGAKQILQNWDSKKLEQVMLIKVPDNDDRSLDIMGLSRMRELEKWGYPLIGVLLELGKYGLIDVEFIYSADGRLKQVKILLLEELRNAVESDFEVSNYFLTMNAVGMMVHGDLTIHPGGILQSAASNTGNIEQEVEQAADKLVEILGKELLQSHRDLQLSIEELRVGAAADQQSKLGKVISELGRCFEHSANAASVVGAIAYLGQFLNTVGNLK